MPELLLELFSEEIPARMQARAAADLKALVTGGLVDAGLTYEGAQSHAGPRRLVLSIEGLAGVTAETTEERKGPRVDAPAQAIEGFLRSAGVRKEDCAEVEDRKGRFLVAKITKPGRETPDIVAELVPDVIRKLPWPKSMRWGTGSLRWVRPLHSIVCTFDGETVPFTIEGIASGSETRGHRFMAPVKFAVRRFEDYAARLRDAFVMVDAGERAETIRTEAANLAFAQGFEVVEDEALIAETAGLAEWPVVLMGSFDAGFLDLPPEVIATSLRSHQKCFSLRRRGAGEGEALANRYLLVANLIAKDGGKHIVAGNDRVIAARLADARFFWDQDRKTRLEDLLPQLEGITFHGKLGNQRERVERLESLAGEIAAAIGADVEQAKLAARLCKTDLVTGMVGEFPELQGLMGYYYALAEGHDPAVAEAIRDHYKPQGPSDSVPASPVSQAVALADKLDILMGFWAINEKPTGSKDPYALRRAALGVVRIILTRELRIHLSEGFVRAGIAFAVMRHLAMETGFSDKFRKLHETIDISKYKTSAWMEIYRKELGELSVELQDQYPSRIVEAETDLLAFFADRLKVHLREQGARHDLIDAVFALGASAPSPLVGEGKGGGAAGSELTAPPTPGPSPQGGGVQDDLLMIVRRVEALGRFLETEDGANLLAGVKRAINIVRIEEKRDATSYEAPPDRQLLVQGEERALATAIDRAEAQAKLAIDSEDFEAAMRAIAKLREPIDHFFDHVTVNAEDRSFRENRLKLLNRIRAATLTVADFSRIEG